MKKILFLTVMIVAGCLFFNANAQVGDTDLVFAKDGKVGINDTTPDFLLDVNGDINFTGKFRQNGHEVSIDTITHMTVPLSDLGSQITAGASSFLPVYMGVFPASNFIDGIPSTYWVSDSVTSAYITVGFGDMHGYDLNSVSISSGIYAGALGDDSTYLWGRVAIDSGNYTDWIKLGSSGANAQNIKFDFPQNKFIEIKIVLNNSIPRNFNVSEVSMFFESEQGLVKWNKYDGTNDIFYDKGSVAIGAIPQAGASSLLINTKETHIRGIDIINNSAYDNNYGINISMNNDGHRGYGINSNVTGTNPFGIKSVANGDNAIGLWSSATGTNSYAGYFVGRSIFKNQTSNSDYLIQLENNTDTGKCMKLIAGHGSAAGKEYPIFKVSRYSTGDNITDLFQVDGKSGITRAREIKVDALTWSDNVFNKEYKLLSLNDLQSFIEKNKHLPDVPTENEVKQDGINVAEMNALLLKKIEELSLYIIELNTKIEEQKKVIQSINK